MTTSPATDRDRAEDEAATWLIVLSDAPDDAGLRERFETWRAASPLNVEAWTQVSRAYALIGQVSPQHPEHWAAYAAERRSGSTQPAGQQPIPLARAPQRARTGARRLRVGVGAALVAAALLIVFAPDLSLRMQADAMTATAQVRAVTLPDGSRVRLAPQSAVDVAFESGERRVRLLKGQAFFEVTPDRTRPFRVEAGDAVVTVVGTAFEVRRGDDGARIAVRRGHVRVGQVGRAGEAADLHAGDWIETSRRSGAVRGDIRPQDVAEWLEGRVVARDRSAGEVVAALRPYYRGAILVRSKRFDHTHVSGIYDLSDPVSTLRALGATHGARVRQISPWVVLVTD